MPHSKFGWSYPPGCSGPPGEVERACACLCSEMDHESFEDSKELGQCLNEHCDCEKFTLPTPEDYPDPGDPTEEEWNAWMEAQAKAEGSTTA